MATPIVIPNVGESVTSGVVSAWHKADGEFVERDDIVLDLETDKITVEVRAPAAGVLKQMAKVQQTVEIGAVVGEVDEAAGNGKAARASKPAAAGSSPARTAGAASKAGTTATLPPPAGSAKSPAGGEAAEGGEDSTRATPLARKAAADLGVDLAQVAGTGAGRRIREEDVVAFAKARGGKRDGVAAAPAASAPAESTGGDRSGERSNPDRSGERSHLRGVTRERLSPLRQRIAERLVEAQRTAAMLTTFNECDMSGVVELRKRYKEDFEKRHGVGLGFMSFFVRAVVNALAAHPAVNAYLVDDGGQPALEKHSYCDIGVAVAGPKGLVVPVLRDAQRLSFAAIEQGIKDLSTRAREGKLTLEEIQGGTFSITNGGVFGSLMSTPILNPPQSGILGMHAIKNRAVEDPTKPGQVAIRPMMYLALSYDHRVIDGEAAVKFLVAVKQAIEDPARLMLDL